MLSVFFTTLTLLGINFGNGILIRKLTKLESHSFVSISFLGIIAITFLETIILFLGSLDSYLEIIFIFTGILGIAIYIIRERNYIKIFRINFWFYFFLCYILFISSFPPYLYDHFSYYIPTINVIKEIGFVKGISNLDILLGQSSFWHIYQAGFSHFVDPFLKINAYISVLFIIYVYERRQFTLFIFIPIILLFVAQPSPDLTILIITIFVINELINGDKNPIILYLSLFVFCIKPIVFWLPIWVVINQLETRKLTLKFLFPTFIFCFLVIAKNLWLFGYPIFPVSSIDFNLSWKPSEEIMRYSSQIGLMKSFDMQYSYQKILNFSLLEKIRNWFTIGYKSIFNIGILISLIIIGVFVMKKKNRLFYSLFILLILKTIIVITFSAQYRFFIDVYATAIFLTIINFREDKITLISSFISIGVCIGFIFPSFFQSFKIGNRLTGFNFQQFYRPQQISYKEKTKEYKIGNLHFHVSKNTSDQSQFPSINLYKLKLYDYYGIFPQYFKSDYSDGFIQRKLTNSEKEKLKIIISETENLKL